MNLDGSGGDGIRTHEPLRERMSHARTYVDLESRQVLRRKIPPRLTRPCANLRLVSLPLQAPEARSF